MKDITLRVINVTIAMYLVIGNVTGEIDILPIVVFLSVHLLYFVKEIEIEVSHND